MEPSLIKTRHGCASLVCHDLSVMKMRRRVSLDALRPMLPLQTLAIFCLISPGLAAGQDVAVNGIKLGMTLQEAQAKLPPDMHISTPRTDFPPQFTTVFAQRIPFTGSDIDDEAFTIEAVDGKVAYVKQIITYSPARAIDRQEFQQSLVPKYGPMSPYPPNVTPAVFPIWSWDRNGKLAANGDVCPGGLVLANGASGLYRPAMITSVPANQDLPGCHVVLSVLFDRRTDSIPFSKLDWVELTLSDNSRFFGATATNKSEQMR